MVTGWRKVNWNNRSDWYLFHSSGKMLTGWQLANGKWYYLYEKTTAGHPVGSLAVNTKIATYTVDADGVWTKQ